MQSLAWCIYYINHFCVLPSVAQALQQEPGGLPTVHQHEGVALVNGCLDKLSHDSAAGRIKISHLNGTWGNALSELGGREEKLKEGIGLAGKYQVISSNLQ